MDTRKLRAALPVGLLLLAVGVSACGGGTAPTSEPTTVTSEQPPEVQSPTPEPAATQGIIMAVKTDDNTVELRTLNPDTGEVIGTKTFSSPEAYSALDNSDPGNVWRQAFNHDLTAVAATGPEGSDGSQGVGIVTENGYEQTSEDASGYDETLKKQAIGFNPKTNELWYQTPQGSGSDEGLIGKIGPDGDKVVKGELPHSNGMIGGLNNRLWFAPNGKLRDILEAQTTAFLPGGTEVERDPLSGGFQIGKFGKVHVDSPTTPARPSDATIGWMGVPVDGNTFLTKDDNKLLLNTIGSNAVRVKSLLPKSNRQIGEMIVNPMANRVTFTTQQDEEMELWSVSLDGKSNPVQLTGFDPNLGGAFGLIAWQ